MPKPSDAKYQRNWYSTGCLIAVVVIIGGGSLLTSTAVVAGEPFKAGGYLLLATGLALYYLALFFWSLGYRLFEK